MAPKRKWTRHLQNAGRASANKKLGIEKGSPARKHQDEGVHLRFMLFPRGMRYRAMPILGIFA
jgi:hypothetical protein